MRSRLSRHLRHLAAASLVLLGTAGVLAGTTGILAGASTACGCEGGSGGGREANPVWYVEGASLENTENITVKAVNTQELTSTASKPISCKHLTVNEEAGMDRLIANTDSGGIDGETLVYSECTYPESGCKVSTEGEETWGTIETSLLESKLEYTTKAEAEKEEVKKGSTLTVFKPVSGSVFMEIEFDGSGCPGSDASFEGSVAVENVGEAGTETGAEATEHELNAPATSIKTAFYNEAGKTEEAKAELKAFGVSAAYIGKATMKLEGRKKWSVQGGPRGIPVIRAIRIAGGTGRQLSKQCFMNTVGETCTIRVEIVDNPSGRELELTQEEIFLVRGPGGAQGFGFERTGNRFANECRLNGTIGRADAEYCEVRLRYEGRANPGAGEYNSLYRVTATERGGRGSTRQELVALLAGPPR